MRASLCSAGGILWIARFDARWRVAPHDPDGRALAPGFVVPSAGGERPRIEALAVDADRRVWVADSGARRVRAFTAFGAELAGLPPQHGARSGAEPCGVDVEGVEEDALVLVARRGAELHALELVRPDGALVASLRSRGEPGEPFRGLGRCALRAGVVHACEPATGLVQVFRRDRFHFAFRAPGGAGAIPEAVRALADGRLVVATGGEGRSGVHLCDASGRTLLCLAGAGEREGEVLEPEDLALVEEPGSDRRTRVVVADQGGARVQVFNLEGVCHGAFLADDGPSAVGGAR